MEERFCCSAVASIVPMKKSAKSTPSGLPIATPSTWQYILPRGQVKGDCLVKISSSVSSFSSGMLRVGVSSHLYTLSRMKLMVRSTGTYVKRHSTSSEAIMWSSASGEFLSSSRKSLAEVNV